MFGLIPKEEKFFDLFREMTQHIVQGAQLLKDMIDNAENPAKSQRDIKDIEHKGDALTHSIIDKLNRSFITPFEREDIYALASGLDDILDFIDAAATHITTYKAGKPTQAAKELAFIILQSCHTLDKAISTLSSKTEHKHLTAFCVDINSLENEADRVYREAVGNLFEHEKDPIQLIKWKEIYEILEIITDKCEDVANTLESIVVKNA